MSPSSMPGRPSCPPVVAPLSLASILSVMATPCSKPPANLSTQFYTNHLSHLLLLHLLKPLPLAPTPSRLISVSSAGHRKAPTSAAQGAATIVYAAVGAEFEGRGGLRLADCAVQGPFRGRDPTAMDDGGLWRGRLMRWERRGFGGVRWGWLGWRGRNKVMLMW